MCEANDICYNECPEHSTAPAGSDEDRDCVCDPGFFGLYGADNDVSAPRAGGHEKPASCCMARCVCRDRRSTHATLLQKRSE